MESVQSIQAVVKRCTSRIAQYIGKTLDSREGNYMAFFPSYRLMEAVYEKFLELGKKSEVLLQSQYMDEEEREEFLKKFEKRAGRDVGGILCDGRYFFGRDRPDAGPSDRSHDRGNRNPAGVQ